MHYTKIKRVIGLVVLLAVAGFASASISVARADDDNRAPDLPSPLCDNLQVPAGHKVSFHTYALGVQIYRWNGAGWDLLRPDATLYADANFRGKVGTHYGGPTWEGNDGSYVIAKRPPVACSVDSTAIDWLRLQALSTEGSGIFGRVTYIQRVNTVGGKAPTTPGAFIGAEARIPYTTEYYFYRAEN